LRAGILRLTIFVAALAVLAFPASAAADNPPTATITSPSTGSVLRGLVTVKVKAADDVGVDHVDYYFDDGSGVTQLGTSSTPPFTFTFDSTALPNCASNACSLYAQAVDSANQTSGGQFGDGISVGVDNPIVVDPGASDGSDSCSLRNAIAAATDNISEDGCKNGLAGTPDTIELPARTYNLGSQLTISSDLILVGAGAHSVTIHSQNTRAFEIAGSANVGITGVSISGNESAAAGGGILVDSGGSLVLQGVIVTGSSATSGGGIENLGSLTIAGSTIGPQNFATAADGEGGGIQDIGGSLSITNSTVIGNTAQGAGGGLYLEGTATLTNDTIANNDTETAGGGGGLAVGGPENSIDVVNTIVAQNTFSEVPSDCAGPVTSLGHNLSDRSDCAFDATGDQQSTVPGFTQAVDSSGPTDAMPLANGSPAIDKGDSLVCPAVDQRDVPRPQGTACDIGAYEFTSSAPTDYDVSTVAELAGAVSSAENLESPATIHLAAGHYDVGTLVSSVGTGIGLEFDGAGPASTILDGDGVSNRVFDIGGDATTTIKELTVENSGNVGIDDNGDLELDDSVVQGNALLGISSSGLGLTVSDSTISGNGNANAGVDTVGNGGIYSTFTPVTLTNTTITGNEGSGIYAAANGSVSNFHLKNVTIAGNPGAGIALHAVVDAVNTIIADNEGGDCLHAVENMTTDGHNLDSDGSCTFSQPTDLPSSDPRLHPLDDNGGPTPTMALSLKSPAVDAGDDASCPSTDQRGSHRPLGLHCDIGAYEQFAPTVNTEGDPDVSTTSCDTGGLCSLRAAIQALNSAGGGLLEFDIPSGDATPVITLPAPLDPITAQVSINGLTQREAHPDEPGNPGDPGDPGVTIIPDWAGSSLTGDVIDLAPGSSGSTVHGLALGGFTSEGGTTAIGVESDQNTITGNWIGVGADSSQLDPGEIGIDVTGNDNTIGGDSSAGDGNVIASTFQGPGMLVESADGNVIQGNTIGLFPDGSVVGGGVDDGIRLEGATNTVIGNDVDTSQLADVQAHPELGNVVMSSATTYGAIALLDDSTFTIGTSGTIVAGNFIGVDRDGQTIATTPGPGVDVEDSGPNQIGPGNVIAHLSSSGVRVYNDGDGPSGDGNRIAANSIFDTGPRGIDLVSSGNADEPAPVVDGVTAGNVSGTVSSPDNQVFLEVFVNPSCTGQFANGAGQTYATFEQTAPGTFSIPVPGLTPGEGVTVTATGFSNNDTSEFSNCFTVGGAGTLSGSVSTSGQQNADLTSLGTQDWAVWGYANNGTSTSLAPDARKAGGSGISDLTDIHVNGAPLRGLGQFASQGDEPFSFDWSDGTVPASATGAFAGLEHDGQPGNLGTNGDGFSFTVPADTTQRTLTVYTSAHWATGTLTATLSDGSAQPYTQDLVGSTAFPSFGGNSPGVFTINYAAASPGQHLTVNLVETAANCPQFGCDDAAIYAVALAGQTGNSVSSASASLDSDPSVAISGSVPTSHIPLAAFDPQPPGAPPITINGLQLANTQLANTQLAHTQLANTQLANTQLANTQLANTQLANTQLAHTQLANTQLANTQLANTPLMLQLANTQLAHTQLAHTGLPLTALPLDPAQFPNGWAGLLQGTTLAGAPLQTITLHDVLALTSPPNPADAVARIQGLDFANIALPSSTLGQITIGALALGGAEVNDLGGALQSDIESQLQSWCQSAVPAADTSAFCGGANPLMGDLSLIQLGLLGAPVATLQLANTQLANTQLANTQLASTQLANTQLAHTPVEDFATSASGIVGMQLAHTDLTPDLGIADLLVSGLPSATQNALFDCTNPSHFDCSTGTLGQAQAAGAIKPTATVGDLDVGDFLHAVTIYQLLQTVLGPNSAYADTANFGDLVGLFLRSTDVQWESLAPSVLSIFDPSRPTMSMTADFDIQGTGSPSADVKVAIPAGFDYMPGSATLTENQNPVPAPGDPTITQTGSGPVLDWHFDAIDPDHSYALKFNVYSGATVGPAQATETITAGGQSDSSIRPFSVTDSFPNDKSAATADGIDTTPGHESVEMSALPTAGAVDYYTIPMPAAGTRISVHLTNLAADYDLALYSPQTTSVRTTTNLAPPLQDGVVPDTQVDLNGGSSGQLTPTGLEDVPDPGIPLVQLSDNRHQDDEDVGMVSPGGSGVITVAVFGYNGAFSPQPYTLRVREYAPPATPPACVRTLPDSGQGSTPDSLPALSSLPANLNTIILVDEKRLGDTYGTADEANAVGKLHSLAGDASLGVSGVVVPVETIPGVQGLYNTWDNHSCDPNAANAVANPIADEVNAIVAARPSVKYVVFAGGDDQIPFFRLPDLSLVANESGFADQFSPNEYQGSLAAGDLLSDDPYLDTRPVPASGQQLFPPNLAGGRLVETAQDIATAITNFEHAPTPGALKSSTGFVSGYDFVADGSKTVATNLRNNGVTVQTLIDDPLDNPLPTPFSEAGLLAAAFPNGGPADINSWNGHYDNYRAQMANGDILSTTDPLLPSTLHGGVFFTMGCHAGFQTTDAVVGSSVLDWPQYFSQHDTGFVGNTGFGLGDTDSVAFSEELMADFAGKLGGSNTLGGALLQAKQQYYLSRVAFSNYDEKALSEAELYGLPMYGIGHAPSALAAPAAPSPDPVTGASASTSPTQGSLSSFPGSGVQSSNFAVTPSFSTEQHGLNGDFFTNAGQVQAPNYRPLQPYLSLPAARTDSPGLYAHGVVIDMLTSQDHTPFTPDNVRPTLNTSAAEPPPSFTDESWPEKIPTLVSLGQNQNLNLATGQFFTEAGSSTTGVERLWTQINGRVTYSTSQDFTPPTIDSISAFQTNGILGFTGRFSDLDQNGNPGTVVFAQVVYDDGTGHWQAVQLQKDPVSGLWSAGVPFTASHVQYFVEICDAAGNCGYSSNKGNYFDAQPLPSGSGSGGSAGTLTISPSRQADSGSWYTHGLTATAATTAPDATVSVTVDGVAQPPGPVNLSGDGAHIVVARDSAGNVATAAYLIDTTGPTITPTVSPAAPDGTNGWYKTKPTVTFNCSDNLSGVASCKAGSGPGNQVTLGDSATSQTVNASAKDNAGNTSTGSATVTKIDSTAPATPVFHGITNGTTYKPSALPAQSAITCTSSDGLSGLASCVVTGYSAALGTHTLTATATDKAGNTTTATLTYTVAKLNPTITWNPPATILFGTKLSSTQLNATASVAGTFVYNPAAGTLLQPGSQTLSVTFTPTNTTDYNTATATRTITVGFSQACQTGSLSGSLTIKSGTAYCIQGGKVSGSITVQSGGSLYVSNGSISGSISSTGATALTMCGSSVSGSMSISSSSGLVQLGGPSGSGCAGDKISASLSLSGNTAGVTVFGDTISGSVSVASNKGGVLFSANKVSASISVTGNSGGVTFTNNTVSGSVSITNNTGGFTFSGNTISGSVTLKNNT
jgi:uncharacterized protein YjbI with pentapeptide repeats